MDYNYTRLQVFLYSSIHAIIQHFNHLFKIIFFIIPVLQLPTAGTRRNIPDVGPRGREPSQGNSREVRAPQAGFERADKREREPGVRGSRIFKAREPRFCDSREFNA